MTDEQSPESNHGFAETISIAPPDPEDGIPQPSIVAEPLSQAEAANKRLRNKNQREELEFSAIIAGASVPEGNAHKFIIADDTGYHATFRPVGRQNPSQPRRVSYLAKKNQIVASSGLSMNEAVYIVAVAEKQFSGIKLVSPTAEADKIKLYVAAQTHHMRTLVKKLEMDTISASERQTLAQYIANPDAVPAVKFQDQNGPYTPPTTIQRKDLRTGKGVDVETMTLVRELKTALAREAVQKDRSLLSPAPAPQPPVSTARVVREDYRELRDAVVVPRIQAPGTLHEVATFLCGDGITGFLKGMNEGIHRGGARDLHLGRTATSEDVSKVGKIIEGLIEDIRGLKTRGVRAIPHRNRPGDSRETVIANMVDSVRTFKEALDAGNSVEQAKHSVRNRALGSETIPTLANLIDGTMPQAVAAAQPLLPVTQKPIVIAKGSAGVVKQRLSEQVGLSARASISAPTRKQGNQPQPS